MTIRTETRQRSNVTEVYIFDGATYLGYARKFKNTRTETYPWQGIESELRGSNFASFYGAGAKQKAIAFIVNGR